MSQHRLDAYRNMLRQFAKPGALVAVVFDSYDLDHAVQALWGRELRQAVIDSGATVVIRPDSGEPFQGDGITRGTIGAILSALEADGWSADNVAFGQGGALLQQVNRDTQRFAMKASAVRVDGRWRDVYKDPATDPAKRSKAGRLTLLRWGDDFATVRLESPAHAEHLDAGWRDALRTVYEDGRLLVEDTFAQVRERAAG